MADNFDNLIKEKVEEKQFPYNEAAWKSFKRYSGHSGAGIGAKIAIAAVSAVTIGSIAFYAIMGNHGEKTTYEAETQIVETPQHQSEEPFVDTFAANQKDEITQQISKELVSTKQKTANKDNGTSAEVRTEITDSAAAKDNVEKQDKVLPHREEPSRWRVNIINVDTIR